MSTSIADTFVVKERVDNDDLGYVAKSWKASLYDYGLHPDGTEWKTRSKSAFFAAVNEPINKTLQRAATIVLLDPGDKRFIVGWVCFDDLAVHYVFTRNAVSGCGIGDQLLRMAGVDMRAPCVVTHKSTHRGAVRLQARYGVQYQPGLIYGVQDDQAQRGQG